MKKKKATKKTAKKRAKKPPSKPSKQDRDRVIPDLRPLLVRVSTLKPDPENAMGHGEENIEDIKTSITSVGIHRVIVARKEGRVVKIGNGLLQAAKELGWKWVPAALVDESREKSIERALRDNRSAQKGEWIDRQLALSIGELDRVGYDIASLGWSPPELETIESVLAEPPDPAGGMTDVSFSANTVPDGYVRFKFGDVSGFVAREVYDKFLAKYEAGRSDGDEGQMLDDLVKRWVA